MLRSKTLSNGDEWCCSMHDPALGFVGWLDTSAAADESQGTFSSCSYNRPQHRGERWLAFLHLPRCRRIHALRLGRAG